MRDHLRAFAKLVMALDSLPGVTLANSSTALFESRMLQIANDTLYVNYFSVFSPCHQQLRAAAPIEGPWLLDSGGKNTQGIVETPVSLPDNLLCRSTEDNAASFSKRNSTELQ